MAIHAVPTNFDTTVANEAGRHATPVALPPGQETDELYWGEDGLSFGDVIDVVNPLHHLPVVGTAYREMTGDEIAPAAKIIGGMIFGGPIGMVLAIFSAIFEEATGKDIGTAVADIFTDDGGEAGSQLAEAGTAPSDAPQAQAPTVAMATAEPVAAAPAPAALSAAAGAAALPQLAPAGAAPQLSPQAFDALVRSFNGPISRTAPAAAAAPPPPPASPALRPGVAAGAGIPAPAIDNALPSLVPVGKPLPLVKRSDSAAPAHDNRRQAALDLHQQLRAYAEDKGVTVAALPTR
ncbi:MAG: hypothetical protein RIM84_11650 [Alphaproteobacteria bacterium]